MPQTNPVQHDVPVHEYVAGRQQPPLMHSSWPQQSSPPGRVQCASKLPQQTCPSEVVPQTSPAQHAELPGQG